MKKILSLFLCLFFISTIASALEIKKSATPKLPVCLIDSTDHVTGKTGITSPTVYYVVQDGTATAKSTPTFGELDATNMKGLYQLTLDSTMTGTVGKLVIYVTKAGCDDFRAEVNIVDNLESDSYGKVSGLTYTTANQVDARVLTNSDKTGYALTQTFPTNFSSLAITAGGAVTAGTVSDKTGYTCSTVSDKTGYSLTQTFPTNFSSLSISASTGLVDITQTGADKVWGTTARTLTAGTNIALAKGSGITGFNDIAATDVWSAGTRTLTAGTNIALAKGTGVTGFNDLNAAGVAAATWNAATATYGTSGSYGLLIETDLDTNIGSRGTGTSTLTAANVWDTDISGYSGTKAGTYVKGLYDKRPASGSMLDDSVWTSTKAGYVDVAISSRGTGTSTLTAANVWDANISAYSGAGYAGTYLKGIYDKLPSGTIGTSTYAGGAVASVTGSVGSISGITFPTNFSALSISATTGLVDITQPAADKTWGTTEANITTSGSIGKKLKNGANASIGLQ